MTKKGMQIRAEKVIVILKKMFGEGIDFECVDCFKSNETLTGIFMRLPGCSKIPVIYMEDMPETASVEETANLAAAAYQQAMRDLGDGKFPPLPDMDREYILDNVVLQVLSRKRNKQLLKVHPHVLAMDLAGIFRIPVGTYELNSLQSKIVTNRIAETFDLSAEELAVAARRNTLDKFGVKLLSARKLRQCFLQDQQMEAQPFETVKMDQPGMYTLTNDIQINGAALMLIPAVLEQIGEKAGMNYYVLPSSIHEVMIARDDGSLSPRHLKSVVREANHSPNIVQPTDILSDSVYYYCRRDKKLSIIK